VNNTNLPPIFHSFRDMADYWSNFWYWQQVPSLNELAGCDPLQISR